MYVEKYATDLSKQEIGLRDVLMNYQCDLVFVANRNKCIYLNRPKNKHF